MRLARRTLAGLVSILVLRAQVARACSVCAAGDPLVAASDSAGSSGAVRAGLETEWLTASAGLDPAHGHEGEERVEQATVRALAVYSPVPRLNLALQVPIVRKTTLGHETIQQEGLGDVDLGGRWFVLDRTNFEIMRHQSFAVSAGSSLPTGENDAAEAGVLVDEHAQLGTGALGPYAGLLYRLEQSRWHAFVSLTARYRLENGRGYRYGASLAWTVQAQRQLGSRFAVSLGLDGRNAGRDREEGLAQEHTGGFVLAAVPSVHFGLGERVWLGVRAQLPFATSLHGVQDVGPTFTAGVQVQVL